MLANQMHGKRQVEWENPCTWIYRATFVSVQNMYFYFYPLRKKNIDARPHFLTMQCNRQSLRNFGIIFAREDLLESAQFNIFFYEKNNKSAQALNGPPDGVRSH